MSGGIFDKVNEIENKILDGVEFNQIIKDYNLNESVTVLINQENKSKIYTNVYNVVKHIQLFVR